MISTKLQSSCIEVFIFEDIPYMKVRREEESKSKEARKRSNARNFQGNLVS